MGISLSHGRSFDVGNIGIEHTDLPLLGDSPEQSRLDLSSLWDPDRRDQPIELEIGSGKGTFLVQQASQRTNVNYLGVEYAKQYWRYAADRCRRHSLNNVRVLHDDAAVFVAWRCSDEVFQQVHIYFPDPWPKKRHHKRRLINESFLRNIHRTLQPNGIVRIVTDHDDYFAWMQQHISRVADLFEQIPFQNPVSADAGEVVGTNFERKYRREGRPFNAIALRKV